MTPMDNIDAACQRAATQLIVDMDAPLTTAQLMLLVNRALLQGVRIGIEEGERLAMRVIHKEDHARA
jgi:hypothetical protein